MRFSNLADWLLWQESLNPKEIDLGLDRVREVWARLASEPPRFAVVTVAGTNGKGSSVAMLESILRCAGYSVGAYTSPHLLRYNERVRLGGLEVSDAALVAAFDAVDRARADVPLTYFEFGTLAALTLFRDAGIDIAVLEVGLGGRLDAVNIIDADVALVTSIGIDHVDWLGPDRESIGREKAGIFRSGRPAVCADPEPPASVTAYAAHIGAPLYRLGPDFNYGLEPGGWRWDGLGRSRAALPLPALRGGVQLQNAAAVLAVLELLAERFPVDQNAVRRGLLELVLPGRFQVLPGPVEWILDVTHNPDGAKVLADNLRQHPCAGRTLAVVGMLEDKDVEGVARVLGQVVDQWYAAGLSASRGMPGTRLAERLGAAAAAAVQPCDDVAAACAQADAAASVGDRVLVFGSFHTVAEAMQARV